MIRATSMVDLVWRETYLARQGFARQIRLRQLLGSPLPSYVASTALRKAAGTKMHPRLLHSSTAGTISLQKFVMRLRRTEGSRSAPFNESEPFGCETTGWVKGS